MGLCHDQVIRWAKAQVHVCSVSVMCHQRISHPSAANIKWKEQIQYFQQSNEYAEFRELMENKLSSSGITIPGFPPIEIFRRIQKDLDTRRINPDRFERRILFMSMFNDIAWAKNGNSSECISNAREVSHHARECQRGHWSFFGPGDDKKMLRNLQLQARRKMEPASQSDD